MRVLIVGAGLMGAQIGCEYALGGHEVALYGRDADAALERFEQGLDLVLAYELAEAETVGDARERVVSGSDMASLPACDLALESLPEDMELKASLLRVVAEAWPKAILATNTSSLSVTELGERIDAPERTLGTHYWNPPLLMPLVEVVPGAHTTTALVECVCETLGGLGKRPVLCGDVPGFVWNRLQMAVLREAVWLVEKGIASPQTVDEILTRGLARRWANIGFFQAIALGGVDTWQRTAANLLPQLSAATEIGDLARWIRGDSADLASAAAARDRGLAADLREERDEPLP